ncbi:ketopantoate reductase family protein [Thalassolituus hydrocarboniclasticus]|uniref:2-dehydropantoate 2-reductase n=1 Tax=Thalassolituus hydrocarboniclasticus TaxID=2742796 RepID=A0ABY6AEZ4_9GAMM|nr:2-dehydropantoate 2-reductase [Thalassolituus hydrocarboniclasticus]UXD88448.1 2-dehydropantoate 2-reductase [Thalassolituus hydrocarboniclasticus]
MTISSPSAQNISRQSPLSIGLLGTGAVGTLMASHWRQHRVFALPRDKASAVTLNLYLPNNEAGEQQRQWALPCWQGEPLDWLVVTTKAADTLNALQPWLSYLPQVNNLLLLQNGMGQQQQCADWLAQQQLPVRLWAGISTAGGYRREADNAQGSEVVYAGAGQTIAGRWSEDDSEDTQLPPEIEAVSDIHNRMREKLAVNAVINPLTAILRCHNGELVSNPLYLPQLQALAAEVDNLYQQLHWPLSQDLTGRVEQVALATAANRSSTLQDILAGRTTELPYICGYLQQQAHNLGLPLPLTDRLMQQLQV